MSCLCIYECPEPHTHQTVGECVKYLSCCIGHTVFGDLRAAQERELIVAWLKNNENEYDWWKPIENKEHLK